MKHLRELKKFAARYDAELHYDPQPRCHFKTWVTKNGRTSHWFTVSSSPGRVDCAMFEMKKDVLKAIRSLEK